MAISLQDIHDAAERIESAVINTRFEKSLTLSSIFGVELSLKFENLQFTSSFKERGALNKLLQLPSSEKQSGVVAMSAGNHAKAVAYHAQRLGIPATIVMPNNTPIVKVEDTRNFNAEVILEGDSLEEATAHAFQLAESKKLSFVHPFDDEQIIAGQGTVALEMLNDDPDLDALVVPIGGGGLIAGVAIAAKALKPSIKIFGVEVTGYPGASDALKKENTYIGGSTIAEGIAVKHPGTLAISIIQEMVDDIIIVDDETIEEAINLLITIEKTVTEGAGAASLAAVMTKPELFNGLRTGIILTGANIDSRILASVLMRRLVRKGRIVRYLVKINDSPGSLSDVTARIAEIGGNILEVSHQRMFSSVPVKEADLYLTVETRDSEQSKKILERLCQLGYTAELLVDGV
ncbi:MAG: threonine ammonia-lyase [SAR86 cluster bacterium]|uniref:Threonine ammonia-lyase n=1 Tax=SAR86 cluster bacterium TaxID=2030880 RepID=A0A2A5AXW8_9GAMM|nr:MAG: threonine ammonia-lyase [SAR86 cluster bacterium]